MKSKWKVTSNPINGKSMYAVYRQRDVNATDHSGNRKYATGYTDNEFAAESIANNLNKLDDEEDVRRCRVCGCTDDHACPGGCYWVEEDLCSECVGK